MPVYLIYYSSFCLDIRPLWAGAPLKADPIPPVQCEALDEIAQAQIRTITLLVCTRSSQPCEGHDFGEFCARSVLITSGPRRMRRSFSSCTWASEHTCATTRPRCVKGVSASRRHNVLLCSSGSNRFRAYTRACDCPLLHMCMCACACSSRARITSAWR